MRPITKEARCAYQVHTNPAAISVATIRALREATTPPTGPVLPLDQRGAAPSRRAGGADRRRRPLSDRAAGTGAREYRRGDRPAPGRGAVPGADVRRRRLARGRASRGRAAGRAARGAGVREPADLPELPDAASALLRELSRRAKTSRRPPGSRPDLIFLVGCQGVHGSVNEPYVIQIGPNPLLMGRHYPLDIAAQCELPDTLTDISGALTRVHGSDRPAAWARQRGRYAPTPSS